MYKCKKMYKSAITITTRVRTNTTKRVSRNNSKRVLGTRTAPHFMVTGLSLITMFIRAQISFKRQ